MVPFNQVLKLVARLDSQCLANFPWNGCLSLTRYSGMLHPIVPYSLGIPYILIVPYFMSLGKRLLSIARRWPYIQRCGLICDSQSLAVGIRPRSSLTCCSPIYRTGTRFPPLFVIVTPKILSLRKIPSPPCPPQHRPTQPQQPFQHP